MYISSFLSTTSSQSLTFPRQLLTEQKSEPPACRKDN